MSKKVLISNSPNLYNIGDMALYNGLLNCLNRIGYQDITLLSSNYEYDRGINTVRTVNKRMNNVDRFSLLEIIAFIQYVILAILYRYTRIVINNKYIINSPVFNEYLNSDICIAGIDETYTTLYGAVPFFSSSYSILLGRLLRKKVMLIGSSIGPFKNKAYEVFGKFFLNMADLIALREEYSYDYLKKIGVKNSVLHVTADLAFATGQAPRERIEKILIEEHISKSDKPLIGFALSRVATRWIAAEPDDDNTKYNKFIGIMARQADQLIDRLGCTIVFIPHQYGPRDSNDDRLVHRDVVGLMKNKNRTVLIKNVYSSEELRGLIGQMDMLVGSRAHAIISSAITNTPFLALEFKSFKTRGIMGKMLGCDDYVYQIKNIDYDQVKQSIDFVWDNRDQIRSHLKNTVEKVQERALANAILIRDISIVK